jgi:hypothetical protein
MLTFLSLVVLIYFLSVLRKCIFALTDFSIRLTNWCWMSFCVGCGMCYNSLSGLCRETPNRIPPFAGRTFLSDILLSADCGATGRHSTFSLSKVSRRGLTPLQNHHHFNADKKRKLILYLCEKIKGVGDGKKQSFCGRGFCRVFNASLVPTPLSLPHSHPNPSFSSHTHTHTKSF